MRWLAGKALIAMFGLGVVLGVVWLASGKMGEWPVGAAVVLGAWLPLQLWYSAAGRRRSTGVPDGETGAAADRGGKSRFRANQE